MIIAKKTRSFRILALLLAIVLSVPFYAHATSENSPTPYASRYLTSYNSYVYNAAWGKVQAYFDVTGVGYMDEIGLLSIQLYESTDNENWTWVKTYNHSTTSGMLASDKIYHSGYVEYAGTIGRYYKAYVCIWAGKDGDGDSRYMWTNTVKATLLPG